MSLSKSMSKILRGTAGACGDLQAYQIHHQTRWLLGRALSPLFHFAYACSIKELRMACDWTVICQLPEGPSNNDRTELLVAGSLRVLQLDV